MTSADYARYLASDGWQHRRERALHLAQHRCQSPTCEQDHLRSLSDQELADKILVMPRHAYRLEVHHLTYERLGREADDDLIVLCPSCHREQHGIPEPEPEWTMTMADAVASALRKLGPP